MINKRLEYRKGNHVSTVEIRGDNIYIEEFFDGSIIGTYDIPIKLIKELLEGE